MTETKHTPGPWVFDSRKFRDAPDHKVFEITSPNRAFWIAKVLTFDDGPVDGCSPEYEANARLIAAAPELLRVARIEQELHMMGFTKATAVRLGPDAEEAFLSDGAPGLNNWRRSQREAAIAKAEGRDV